MRWHRKEERSLSVYWQGGRGVCVCVYEQERTLPYVTKDCRGRSGGKRLAEAEEKREQTVKYTILKEKNKT